MKRIFVLWVLLLYGGLFANDWQMFMASNAAPVFSPDEMNAETSTVMAAKAKNPKLAFVMSAIIPGSGQVYSKSYVKAAVFLGVEVTAWTLYFKYTDEGQQLEDEFQSYANSHWSEPEYWRWIAGQAKQEYNPDNIEPLRAWEQEHFSHGLHRQKDQQYYEMIGKYHQFSWGWDDFRQENDISITDEQITQRYNETGDINDNRLYYETQRNDSNDAYKKATTATTVAIINHLLSAADAAWTTTRYNKRIQVGLRLEPIQNAYETQTALTLRVNW